MHLESGADILRFGSMVSALWVLANGFCGNLSRRRELPCPRTGAEWLPPRGRPHLGPSESRRTVPGELGGSSGQFDLHLAALPERRTAGHHSVEAPTT